MPCLRYQIGNCIQKGDCCPFSADAFESKFQETLERGLLRLSAENLIESSEINAWMEEYDFGGKKLREIVTDDGNREVLEELIRRLTELKNIRRSRNGHENEKRTADKWNVAADYLLDS